MKKYMQTAGNPVPFQEVVEMTSEEWEKISNQGDLTPYVGKTIVLIELTYAYYIVTPKHYIRHQIEGLGGK